MPGWRLRNSRDGGTALHKRGSEARLATPYFWQGSLVSSTTAGRQAGKQPLLYNSPAEGALSIVQRVHAATWAAVASICYLLAGDHTTTSRRALPPRCHLWQSHRGRHQAAHATAAREQQHGRLQRQRACLPRALSLQRAWRQRGWHANPHSGATCSWPRRAGVVRLVIARKRGWHVVWTGELQRVRLERPLASRVAVPVRCSCTRGLAARARRRCATPR